VHSVQRRELSDESKLAAGTDRHDLHYRSEVIEQDGEPMHYRSEVIEQDGERSTPIVF